MRLGVSVRSAYAVDDPRVGARWMVERAAAADDAGLDSLFVGDHHASGPVGYYQGAPMLGRMLAEWGDRPAGVLMLLPLWHPVLAAEQIGTLASLATGRFVLQCAIGGGAQQFAAMGVSLKHRVARFEQGLDIIRRLLDGEEVTTQDGPYRVERARIAPVCPEPLEVWIGATARGGIERAARLGDGWLANADVVPTEAAEQAALYRAECARHGRDPGVVAIRRDVHVGASSEDAARVAGPVVDAGYRGFRPAAITYGSVDEVTERFGEYASMGYTDVIVRHLADDQSEVLASLERLGSVRTALGVAMTPFSNRPMPDPVAPGQESVWDYPRPPRLEPTTRRLRVVLGGEVVAETERGYRVLETSHPPNYYFPPDDVAPGAIEPCKGTSFCEWKGRASYFAVRGGDRVVTEGAWGYDEPSERFAAIRGHLAFYASRMDQCFVDDELVVPQPGGFYGGWITSDVVGPFKGAPGTCGW